MLFSFVSLILTYKTRMVVWGNQFVDDRVLLSVALLDGEIGQCVFENTISAIVTFGSHDPATRCNTLREGNVVGLGKLSTRGCKSCKYFSNPGFLIPTCSKAASAFVPHRCACHGNRDEATEHAPTPAGAGLRGCLKRKLMTKV